MDYPAQKPGRAATSQSLLSAKGSSYSIHDSAASLEVPQRRPILVKRETDQILSYYLSEDAGRSYDASPPDDDRDNLRSSSHYRQDSFGSQSSSDYSSDSLESHQADREAQLQSGADAHLVTASRHSRKRSSVPSEGGADRRRLAIVEMDPPSFQPNHKDRAFTAANTPSASDLLTRRGLRVDGLALVAPPDASLRSYTNLTPPLSAPIIPDRIQIPPSLPHHHRTASEAVGYQGKGHLPRKSSRDIGIVGTGSSSSTSESLGPLSPTNEEDFHAYAESLKSPVFQIPSKSRTPSPGHASTMYDDNRAQIRQDDGQHLFLSPRAFGVDEALLTPAIGESKDVRQPVVGPVVVQLSPDMLNSRQTLAEFPSPATASTPGLTNSPIVCSPAMHSPYRYYEPGVHSIAGPLPPPPIILDASERTPPPPRPPRLHTAGTSSSRPDIAAIREALQLPKSVSVALASKLSPDRRDTPSPSKSSNSQHDDSHSPHSLSPQPTHIREGAFPPSTILPSRELHDIDRTPRRNEKSNADSEVTPRSGMNESSVPTTKHVVGEPSVESESSSSYSGSVQHSLRHQASDSSAQSGRTGLELRRESSWVSLCRDVTSPESLSHGETSPSVNASVSSPSPMPLTPSPPSKSPRMGSKTDLGQEQAAGLSATSLKTTLLNIKRFSALPRTPSRVSLQSPSSERLHTSSPSKSLIAAPIRVVPRRRIRAAWPLAMQCHDVVAKKSPLERAIGYAEKINELAMYDCGLAEWVLYRYRAPTKMHSSRATSVKWTMTPATHSTRTPTFQPRHISSGSMGSEATFPLRPDAYTATDLAARPSDLAQANLVPALPYPALAQTSSPNWPSTAMPVSNSRSFQSVLGNNKPSTGFFSSLGRKTSVKKDKGAMSAPGSPSRLTKRSPPNTVTPLRPVPMQASPSVPGGPRAAPSRIQRAQTYSISPSPPIPESAPMPIEPYNNGRQSVTGRRPSIFARARAGVATPSGKTRSPEFEQQVDKLHVLVPHADREILAGYLHRAGQDILAIGQYIEDEKNGTLKPY